MGPRDPLKYTVEDISIAPCYTSELAANEGSIAEDTVYFGHRTWRNYLELTLEASSPGLTLIV